MVNIIETFRTCIRELKSSQTPESSKVVTATANGCGKFCIEHSAGCPQSFHGTGGQRLPFRKGKVSDKQPPYDSRFQWLRWEGMCGAHEGQQFSFILLLKMMKLKIIVLCYHNVEVRQL